MGAWGTKTFDNDTTGDWLWELEESDDASVLQAALAPEDAEDYLEAPEGEIIVGACEIICGIAKGPRDSLPENAISWINAHKSLDVTALIPTAVKMIDRVLADNSELKELWQENESDYPAWEAGVTDLRQKLNG